MTCTITLKPGETWTAPANIRVIAVEDGPGIGEQTFTYEIIEDDTTEETESA